MKKNKMEDKDRNMKFNISSRRYLGNKYKLLSFIKEIVENECPGIESVFDVFSGTGSVASAFTDKKLIVNDMMYSNYMAALTWFSAEKYSEEKVMKLLDNYNNLDDLNEENYMSLNFGNTYFSIETCRKIGFIREDIEKKYSAKQINEKERAILIMLLLFQHDLCLG